MDNYGKMERFTKNKILFYELRPKNKIYFMSCTQRIKFYFMSCAQRINIIIIIYNIYNIVFNPVNKSISIDQPKSFIF